MENLNPRFRSYCLRVHHIWKMNWCLYISLWGELGILINFVSNFRLEFGLLRWIKLVLAWFKSTIWRLDVVYWDLWSRSLKAVVINLRIFFSWASNLNIWRRQRLFFHWNDTISTFNFVRIIKFRSAHYFNNSISSFWGTNKHISYFYWRFTPSFIFHLNKSLIWFFLLCFNFKFQRVWLRIWILDFFFNSLLDKIQIFNLNRHLCGNY